MIYFPGLYYIRSRYNNDYYLFFLYLIKYWGSILVFIRFYVDSDIFSDLFFLLIVFVFYFNIYDFFCFENDGEPGAKTVRIVDGFNKGSNFLFFLIVLVVGFYFYYQEFLLVSIVFLFLMAIFFIHNRIPDRYRFITYYLLYFIKPFIFANFDSNLFILLFFSALYSVSYLPYYLVKKFSLSWPNDFLRIALSGISLKLAFLFSCSFFEPTLIVLVVFQIVPTIIELKYRKSKLRRGFA